MKHKSTEMIEVEKIHLKESIGADNLVLTCQIVELLFKDFV